jgi:hypothetical protein
MLVRSPRDIWRREYTRLLHAIQRSYYWAITVNTSFSYALSLKTLFPCRNQSSVKCATTSVTYLTIILLRQGNVERKRWNQCLQIFTVRCAPTELKTVVFSPSGPFHNSSNTYSGISTEIKEIYLLNLDGTLWWGLTTVQPATRHHSETEIIRVTHNFWEFSAKSVPFRRTLGGETIQAVQCPRMRDGMLTGSVDGCATPDEANVTKFTILIKIYQCII